MVSLVPIWVDAPGRGWLRLPGLPTRPKRYWQALLLDATRQMLVTNMHESSEECKVG